MDISALDDETRVHLVASLILATEGQDAIAGLLESAGRAAAMGDVAFAAAYRDVAFAVRLLAR